MALVSAATGVMNSVIEKLATLMGEEYNKQKNMQKEVAFLKDELNSMNAVLKKLANMEEELDPQTKEWRNQVMDMAFHIEDCIDDFMQQVDEYANRGDVGFVGKIAQYIHELRARHNFAKQIKQLKTLMNDVTERRKRYKLGECVSSSTYVAVDPRMHALYIEAANLVGMEGPKEEVTKLLAEDEGASVQPLRVVSIVGFGGLGKTTLANQVYHEVGGQYDCKAFVSVSQRPDILKLLGRVISKVGMPEPTHIDEVQDLIDNIREYLRNKRYFFVIDDIWDESVWGIIRCAFPENQQGSKVITTTRIETVANASCNYQHEFVYKMRPLDDQNSRKLFFSRVGHVCPQPFEEISDEILRKCGGLPLAIISIASLLASQPTRSIEQWRYVCSSLSSNLRTNPTLEGMRQVLKLSYNNLPLHLKTCLLFIGMYPEDYEIEKQDLVRQWAAEGFVSEIHGRDAEEVAGSYFNELVNRSMIQPTLTKYNDEVLYCKVHDMILDLIRFKSEEQNFLSVVDNPQGMTTALQSKVRRLSLHLDYGANEITAAASLSMSHIRSLALFGLSRFKLHMSELKSIRVLHLDCWGVDRRDLTPICKLFQLRYLNIRGMTQVTAMPSDIVHLPCLLHLVVPRRTRLPDGIYKMKSLRTLQFFNVAKNSLDNLKGLGELTNLKDLSITCGHGDDTMSQQGFKDVFWPSMSKLINCNLRSLEICNDSFHPWAAELCSLTTCHTESNLERLCTGYWVFPRVPSWISQHHKLCSLKLTVKKLIQDDVDLLDGLPNLANLWLWIRKSPEERIVFRGGAVAFPVLKFFGFRCFTPCLTFKAGAMPNVQKLQLEIHAHGVEQYGPLTSEGVEHLLNLRQVHVAIYFEGGDTESDRRAADAEAILRNAISVQQGHPSIEIDLRDNGYWKPELREPSSDEAVEEATE